MKTSFSSSSRDTDQTGFTLLELLISSVILALLVMLLMGIANHVTHIWSDGERRRDAARETRAGLKMITDDLHSSVITTNPTTLVIQTSQLENSGQQLFFLVSHPKEQQGTNAQSDLCATGYFIANDPTQVGMRNLYRFHASGEALLKAFQKNQLQELYTTASVTNTATTELLARHLAQLTIVPVATNPAIGSLLMISLSALGDLKKKKTPPSTQDQLLRYTTFLRLPLQHITYPEIPGS